MSKKRKIPYWMRRKESCPECGWLVTSVDFKEKADFRCPRCGLFLSNEEYWKEQHFKWSKEMVEEIEEL